MSPHSLQRGEIFMIFVYMAYNSCRSVVDVSTRSAGPGDVLMIIVHMFYNMLYDACQSVVDVSTLTAER